MPTEFLISQYYSTFCYANSLYGVLLRMCVPGIFDQAVLAPPDVRPVNALFHHVLQSLGDTLKGLQAVAVELA
jgi:hypothetical protein